MVGSSLALGYSMRDRKPSKRHVYLHTEPVAATTTKTLQEGHARQRKTSLAKRDAETFVGNSFGAERINATRSFLQKVLDRPLDLFGLTLHLRLRSARFQEEDVFLGDEDRDSIEIRFVAFIVAKP